MCLTQDGLALDHLAQTEQLCRAGAKWIQLRMKNADPVVWLETARAFANICRDHGAVSIVNDSVAVALAADADGAHVGKLDLDWTEARRRLGAGKILGGTVNTLDDAARARTSAGLDYVGVGPLRFTANKKNLASCRRGSSGASKPPTWRRCVPSARAASRCHRRCFAAAISLPMSALFFHENFSAHDRGCLLRFSAVSRHGQILLR
jgi:hypothetical protein